MEVGVGVLLVIVYCMLLVFEVQGVILKLEFEGEVVWFEFVDGMYYDYMIDVEIGEVIEFVNEWIEKL